MSCRNICLCIICIAGIQRAQKEVFSLLELELQRAAPTRCVVGTELNLGLLRDQ